MSLSLAIRKIGDFDLIMCGRQAIDGDTAQVGPQVADKLGLSQITYVEQIDEVKNGDIIARRRLEDGVETVKGPMPIVLTVHGSAPPCRTRNAKLLMKFKHASTPTEMLQESEDYIKMHDIHPYLDIVEWNVDDLEADEDWLGLSGSPTKVKKVDNIVFTAKESKKIEATGEDIDFLIRELIDNHNIG
jgi:Electron transfer flavoprotein, beta subunit